jgi:hypothetical protein
MHQAYAELYALFETFRRLNIPADDIFFVPFVLSKSGVETVGMAVERDGKRFVVSVDGCIHPEEVRQNWGAYALEITRMSQDELQALWDRSTVKTKFSEIVLGLITRGLI